MKIGDNEKISIWHLGNTGVRNPMRIQDGFRIFASSSYVGDFHGKPAEIGFTRLMNEAGVVSSEGKDGTIGRKWRLMFERYGFMYRTVEKSDPYTQDDLGPADSVTPFGRTFISADTLPAMQECFLRSLSVEQWELPDGSGLFSPLRWILALMLELEKRTGSTEMSRIEFALYGHTTNPLYDIDDVVDHILDLRERRRDSKAKKVFDRQEKHARGDFYSMKEQNFTDYGDMNMRYLRISGILQRKGRGLMVIPEKHVIAEALASRSYSNNAVIDQLKVLTTGAPLPTDDIVIAKQVLADLQKQLKERHIVYDISDLPLNTPAEVNIARGRLEEKLSMENEIRYASVQAEQWQEISDYMTLLISGGGKKTYDEDYEIEVPKEECAVYLEWTLWRAALAINHLTNAPYEVRGFRLDSDFMPVSAAGGGRGDLYCDYKDFTMLTEVTMSTSSRQEAMEGEPVRRHVSDAVEQYEKPVLCLFIAVRVDNNTVETFRHGVWYAGTKKQRLTILPLTLAQYQDFFVKMFRARKAEPDRVADLVDRCMAYRDRMEALAWKEHIAKMVSLGPYGGRFPINAQASMVAEPVSKYGEETFPHGIYFGTRITDTVRGETGVVTQITDKYIVVHYPQIMNNGNEMKIPYGPEAFSKGWIKVE